MDDPLVCVTRQRLGLAEALRNLLEELPATKIRIDLASSPEDLDVGDPPTLIVFTGEATRQAEEWAARASEVGAPFLTLLPGSEAEDRGRALGAQEALRIDLGELPDPAAIHEIVDLAQEVHRVRGLVGIVGRSPAICNAVWRAVQCARRDGLHVLITGETGTGKELIARAIHQGSPSRRMGPFVAVNLGAIPSDLVESELFGHEKGAFTGATARQKGAFERAAGGTLFLDEVGEAPAHVQVALLRVLDRYGFHRVGGEKLMKPDVQVVFATNRDLETLVRGERFREDFFYRISAVRILISPLRERTEDISLLAYHFGERAWSRAKRSGLSISRKAMRILEAHPWLGNARELRNVMERLALSVAGSGKIGPAQVRRALETNDRTHGTPEAALAPDDADYHNCLHHRRIFDEEGGRKTTTAKRLKVHRSTLHRRIERWKRKGWWSD